MADEEMIPTPPSANVPAEEVPTEEHEVTEGKPIEAIEDPDEPLTDKSMDNLNMLLKQLSEGVRMMKHIWSTTQKEFKLTQEIMNTLIKYNSDHLTPPPEEATDEEKEKWDRCNGIDGITEEEVVEIFGSSEHPIIGVEHNITVGRIKEALSDLYAYQYSVREYNDVHNGYMELIEQQEELKVQELKKIADSEPDAEKRAKLQEAVRQYYYRKRLYFLADPRVIDDSVKKRIANSLQDTKKIEYWMERTNSKLGKMKISPKAIMEVWSFEKRYLDEKYHRVDNSLAAFFLSTCTYCKPDEKTDASRNMVVCMVFAIDQIIRNAMPEEIRNEVMANIVAFEQTMLDYMYGAEEPEVVADESPKEPDMSELPPEERPAGLAGDFTNAKKIDWVTDKLDD